MGKERSTLKDSFPKFPSVPTGKWEEKIREDLKGADYRRKLVWRTLDDFDVNPYYRREDLDNLGYLESEPGQFPFVRSGKTADNSWLIRQDIKVSQYDHANSLALDAIRNGATSIGFDLSNLKTPGENQLQTLLNDIPLDDIAINFIIDDDFQTYLSGLQKIITEKGMDPLLVKGSISQDPLGNLAARGNFRSDLKREMIELMDCIRYAREHLPSFHVLNIGGDLFHDSGGSITQELGLTLALGNNYLAELTDMGFEPSEILPVMHFQFSAATSYFMVIAKHRAARYLWSKIAEAYDPKAASRSPMFIHTRSSFWVQTIYDPYVNLLRTTTSSMAAVIGGTDSLQVNPFDAAYRTPAEFSERIARNTQIILKEESFLDKVIDPSSGSYYIENLTDALIERAWEIFLGIEEQGGFYQALLVGDIQESISRMVKRRRERFANRKDLLLGTNHYPNFGEEMKDQIDSPAETDRVLPEDQRIITPILRSRSGVEFVKLRLRTESHPGKKPLAFMLPLGNLAMRRARAMFGCNFFACAGFSVIDNIGFPSPEEGAREALKAKADIVVLCSSDDEYPGYAEALAKYLKGRCILVVSGFPEDHLEQLKKFGFEHFIHQRLNVLQELAKYQALLGIESQAD